MPDEKPEDHYPGLTNLQLLSIWVCQLHEAVQVTLPYTLAVFFVRDYLGPGASEARVGRLTGFLVRDIYL